MFSTRLFKKNGFLRQILTPSTDLPLWSSTKSVNDDKENQYFREKICMTKENIKKTFWHS